MMVSHQRPMDEVHFGINEPQEDEYAIFRTTSCSPLENLVFPHKKEYFLNEHAGTLENEIKTGEWKSNLAWFMKKIFFKTGKRIVSKNPFNSMRIKELASLFPDAKFIHIYRNPLDIVPSTIHMWSIIQKQNCLNRNRTEPSVQEVTNVIRQYWDKISADLSTLPASQYCEICFEDLEKNPSETLVSLYNHFNMPVTTPFLDKVGEFLDKHKNYQKNKYDLPEQVKHLIMQRLQPHMLKFGYLNKN